MERYRNLSGDSGVVAFEAGPDFIKVKFVGGDVYLYTYGSAGKRRVETMKRLARTGRGLSGYISTSVRDAYEDRQA